MISKNIPEDFDNFKIVQISDFHNTKFGRDNQKLVDMIKKAAPDIVVITGDMIDARRLDIKTAISLAQELVKIAPTYYANGNHEARIKEYNGFKENISACGVFVLEDDHLEIVVENSEITLIGMSDPAFYMEETDKKRAAKIEEQLSRIIPDNENYKILLSHRPEIFESYVQHKVDLVFSGHAHGGQFVLPKLGGLYAPGQGFFPSYYSGIYTKENTSMVVSRGIGNSLMPVRINNKPEIIVAELVKR
ncbi:MAG: metallophosphoesterase [Clostridia bacterium]|nr:metallophosphoesterase [Clostridia bacterium]